MKLGALLGTGAASLSLNLLVTDVTGPDQTQGVEPETPCLDGGGRGHPAEVHMGRERGRNRWEIGSIT